jgi:hypothetical protein
MLSIKDFTDEELKVQIEALSELIETREYGSGDYNSTKAELDTAVNERYRREIKTAEAKDRLVLEYLNLSCEFTDPITKLSRKAEITQRLSVIRNILGMKPLH